MGLKTRIEHRWLVCLVPGSGSRDASDGNARKHDLGGVVALLVLVLVVVVVLALVVLALVVVVVVVVVVVAAAAAAAAAVVVVVAVVVVGCSCCCRPRPRRCFDIIRSTGSSGHRPNPESHPHPDNTQPRKPAVLCYAVKPAIRTSAPLRRKGSAKCMRHAQHTFHLFDAQPKTLERGCQGP